MRAVVGTTVPAVIPIRVHPPLMRCRGGATVRPSVIAYCARVMTDQHPEWWSPGTAVAVAHDVRSMHNVGAIFRTADGAGFAGVVLSGISGAPPDPRMAKVALGAEETLPFAEVREPGALLRLLAGAWVVLLEQHERSVAVTAAPSPPAGRRVALVVCGELDGAPSELVDRADVILEIPMLGRKESLNVSVAFGVGAYSPAVMGRDVERGLLRTRGRHPVRDGVLTRGVTQGETPGR